MDSSEKVVLREEDINRALTRIAHEIIERNSGVLAPALVGIHSRGAFLAQRLHSLLEDLLDTDVLLGDLDIGFYRDDVAIRPDAPVLHASHIDFNLTGLTVVIVDDVLFTGRTIRAAIEALFDYGRPQRVQLAVLADRGHRELPIRPDYVGKNLPTSRAEHVHVRLRELDGVDQVAIALGPHGGAGSASSIARVQSTPRSLRPGPACPAAPGGPGGAGSVGDPLDTGALEASA
jgi:pyrimidine operon attenuation protein / uracil phosphoribosyltransferase